MCLVSFSKKSNYNSLNKILKLNGSPTWGYIDITNVCNHQCSWCYNACGILPHSQKRFMTISEFNSILNKLEEIGITQITITGGEPTLHKNLKDFIKLATKKFDTHIASNGDFIDSELALFFANNNVKQTQLNFQGSRFHNQIHNSPDSFNRLKQTIYNLQKANVDVVTMTTIGDYLIDYIQEIFSEAAKLGIERVRVWDATGAAAENYFPKKMPIKELFEYCQKIANNLGYIYSLSYEPYFDADVNCKCPQLQNMYVSIKVDGNVTPCAVKLKDSDNKICNIHNLSATEFLKAYLEFNKRLREKLENKICCFLRI